MSNNRNRLVIIVGLTGVGKTTLIENATEVIDQPVEYLSYGTLLLEEGKRQDLVHNRDEITDLGPEEYDALQDYTAQHIESLVTDGGSETVYVIDTHAALKTPYGFRPGFSQSDVVTVNPDQFIFVRASGGEIAARRATDSSRDRDIISVDELDDQQDVASTMATTFAAVSRTPIAFVDNPEGGVESASNEVADLLIS